MKWKVTLSLLIVLSSVFVFGQKIRYEDKAKLFFGLNGGSTWHTSDVRNIDHGLRGGGFIFGSSFNYDYGKILSFDLRFRYLGGNWYGLDTDTTGEISQNTAVNNYYEDLGYTVQNFKSTQHRASLELAIHLNSVREKTGFDPYIFGGIGYTWTRTMGDLLTPNGLPHDYASNPSGNIINEIYNTPLDMNAAGDPYPIDDGNWAVNLLPSVGFGLGYYFTNRFSLGVEHKTTYFNSNYFDGTIVNQNGEFSGNNDLYHYSGLYIRWYLKNPEKETRRDEDEETTTTTTPITTTEPTDDIDVYTTTENKQPPVVIFTNPSSSPKTVETSTITLRGEIKHVANAQNVTFRQNGAENHNFNFNPVSNYFQSTVELQPGQNVFRLRGTNAHGTDEATMIINYKRNDPTPPIVTITDPSNNPHVTNNSTRQVVAQIQYIDNKSQVTVSLNGQNTTDFNFNKNGINNFTKTITLKPGANTVSISATNNHGTDSDEVTIIYNEQTALQDPPVVSFTNPFNTPITVSDENYNLEGNVFNVDGKNNVTFIQNGNTNNNFNYQTSTSAFSSSVILKPGANIFQLIGTNSVGSDQKTVIINYDMPSPNPPIVTITNPTNRPHTTQNETHNFSATVLNVNQKNQVSLSLNGQTTTSFNFNPSTGHLNTILSLKEGANYVSVTGTNNDGTDTKETTIIYKKPVEEQPPIVEYIHPYTSPYDTENQTEGIVATVLNVSKKSQVNVNLNGANISDFSFDSGSNLVKFDANLIQGVNIVTITGTNNAGVDSKSTTLVYREASEQYPPFVAFLDPIDNPTTVYSSSYFVKARVKYVSSAANIQLKINGTASTNFTFNPSSEIMEFNTSLVNGANIIQITGTNNYGQDVESTTIVYRKEDPVHPPVVNITTPYQSTYHVSTSKTPIVATVLNVNSANAISVRINGNKTYNFNYNTTTKQLDLNMPLKEGTNQLVISASNNAGTSSDNRTIVYKKEEKIDPPFVSYINPFAAGKEVAVPTFFMKAEVKNVEDKNNIQVKFNGQTITQNAFSFNTSTKEVHYTANLSLGNNVFEVRGSNKAGTHSASTNVVYKRPTPECEEPIVEFTNPSSMNQTVSKEEILVNALIHNVSRQEEITLLLNGQAVGNFNFSQLKHTLTRKLSLEKGNNVIEIIAQTDCGRTDVSTTVIYKPLGGGCEKPIIQLTSPNANGFTTQSPNIEIFASTSHIDDVKQLQLLENGIPVDFSFDAGTHTVNATVNLNEGNNSIVLQAANDCGVTRKKWEITRSACEKPTIDLQTNPSIEEGITSTKNIVISGAINDVNQQGITVKHNGSSKNFIYNPLNQFFSASIGLVKGKNTILINAKNECGSTETRFEINHEEEQVVDPPVVKITNPSKSPHNTDNGTIRVLATVKHVLNANQINVRVNNAEHAFTFFGGVVSFDQELTEGKNVIKITATNDGGTDDDSAIIIYKAPEEVLPPVVTFTNPKSDLTVDKDGIYTVNGEVTNLEHVNQLSLFLNNMPLNNYSASMENGKVKFSLTVSISSSHQQYNIVASASNSAGSDQARLRISRKRQQEEDSNCLPSVTAGFGSNHKQVVATSTKDLSNVVLKYSDETTQKFDDLSGKSIKLMGTGDYRGKCITGVWIKSGCNRSNDGPGYGEWVPNNDYDGNCEEEPCEAPEIKLLSSKKVTKRQYNLRIFVDNAHANKVGITHNGRPINCSFQAAKKTFACQVNLKEGRNRFVVTADGCETKTEIYEVTFTNPCDPLTYNLVYPSQEKIAVDDSKISVNLMARNINAKGVSAKLNRQTVNTIYTGTSVSVNNLTLKEGKNLLEITLKNECSEERINYEINYTAPQACGPRINPGNADWQFCLVTPSGTFNRSDLTDDNFNYSGPASSIYFLPIAGGENVTVNGSEFTIQPGMYYLFEGNLDVSISSKHPSAMGHWQVCLEADNNPLFGNGNRKPKSPCQTNEDDGGTSSGRTPTIETKPSGTRDGRSTRNRPSNNDRNIRNEDKSRPQEEGKTPSENNTRPTRNRTIRSGGR